MPSSHPLHPKPESTLNRVVWAAGHLGELTEQLPEDLVDHALTETNTMQQRCRLLPSRVVVYFVIALSLFTGLGYEQVFTKLGTRSGLVSRVSASALVQARRRIGARPLRRIFEMLRGPAPTVNKHGSWYRGLRLCAVDGTVLALPDTWQNLRKYSKHQGKELAGYPHARLVAVIACGTRNIIDAAFGPSVMGENDYFRKRGIHFGAQATCKLK